MSPFSRWQASHRRSTKKPLERVYLLDLELTWRSVHIESTGCRNMKGCCQIHRPLETFDENEVGSDPERDPLLQSKRLAICFK
jgi:hypothetical protein